MLTGPLTVGPNIDAPSWVGKGAIKDWSFSLCKTPGDKIVSAIVIYYF